MSKNNSTVDSKNPDLKKFISRVMDIEERYTFARSGQKTTRKEEVKFLLDEFCKQWNG